MRLEGIIMKVIVLQPKLRFKHLLFARSSWGGLLNSSTAFSSLSCLFCNSAMHFCQVPVHVMIIEGMVVIHQKYRVPRGHRTHLERRRDISRNSYTIAKLTHDFQWWWSLYRIELQCFIWERVDVFI